MHRFKKGDVVVVGEKGPAPWDGEWPRGDVGVVGSRVPTRGPYSETPLNVDMGPDAEYADPSYFGPDELHYIGRL